MTFVVLLVAAWCFYHVGIEEGRKRASRQDGRSTVTRLWGRRR